MVSKIRLLLIPTLSLKNQKGYEISGSAILKFIKRGHCRENHNSVSSKISMNPAKLMKM